MRTFRANQTAPVFPTGDGGGGGGASCLPADLMAGDFEPIAADTSLDTLLSFMASPNDSFDSFFGDLIDESADQPAEQPTSSEAAMNDARGGAPDFPTPVLPPTPAATPSASPSGSSAAAASPAAFRPAASPLPLSLLVSPLPAVPPLPSELPIADSREAEREVDQEPEFEIVAEREIEREIVVLESDEDEDDEVDDEDEVTIIDVIPSAAAGSRRSAVTTRAAANSRKRRLPLHELPMRRKEAGGVAHAPPAPFHSAVRSAPQILYYDFDLKQKEFGRQPLDFFRDSPSCELLLVRVQPQRRAELTAALGASRFVVTVDRCEQSRQLHRRALLVCFAKDERSEVVRRFANELNEFLRFGELLHDVLPALRFRSAVLIAGDHDQEEARRSRLPNVVVI
ncbi:hypothetical protein M3Y99_00604900 [Aphelenchoides fujianensis]|nr:hypothetical protein M3Y99_00604900 [Aphelenchoides fujianensis]